MKNNKKRSLKIYNYTELNFFFLGQVLDQLNVQQLEYKTNQDGTPFQEFGAFYLDDGFQYRYCIETLKRHNRITFWRSDLNE